MNVNAYTILGQAIAQHTGFGRHRSVSAEWRHTQLSTSWNEQSVGQIMFCPVTMYLFVLIPALGPSFQASHPWFFD